jgi:hypothetical protein
VASRQDAGERVVHARRLIGYRLAAVPYIDIDTACSDAKPLGGPPGRIAGSRPGCKHFEFAWRSVAALCRVAGTSDSYV